MHGPWGSRVERNDLGRRSMAKHHSLLLSYLFNLKRGLAFVRDMIIADLRSSIDIGAMQQAADLLVVLRLFFSEYPEAAYVPRGCGLLKENCCEIASNRDPIQR